MKKKRSEFVLLLLPVLPLLGLGWFLRHKAGALATVENRSGPFEIRVAKTTFVPVSPMEFHDGFDTKMIVELAATGKKPAWWVKYPYAGSVLPSGKLYGFGGKKLLAGTVMSRAPHQEEGVWQAEYLMKLAGLPASLGEVRLKDEPLFTDRGGYLRLRLMKLDVPVRPVGTEARVPEVDKTPSLQVEKMAIDDESKLLCDCDQTAKVALLWVRSDEDFFFDPNAKGEFVDSKGRRYPFDERSLDRVTGCDYPAKDGARLGIFKLCLDWGSIPVNVGPLRVHLTLSRAKEWPAEVELPARDAAGKWVLTARDKPRFRIVSVRTRPPDEFEKSALLSSVVVDVTVALPSAVRAQMKLPALNECPWFTFVEDSEGNSYTGEDIAGPKNDEVSVQDRVETKMVNGVETDFKTFSYQLDLTHSSVPSRGRLLFRTQISMDNSERVPVSVVLRP